MEPFPFKTSLLVDPTPPLKTFESFFFSECWGNYLPSARGLQIKSFLTGTLFSSCDFIQNKKVKVSFSEIQNK